MPVPALVASRTNDAAVMQRLSPRGGLMKILLADVRKEECAISLRSSPLDNLKKTSLISPLNSLAVRSRDNLARIDRGEEEACCVFER